MSIKLVMPFNHLILCHPLLLLPSIFPSIKVFSNDSALCIRWPKYWSFSFSISPSNEYSGLISFRIDWLNLLAVQGTLKSSQAPQFKSISSLALSFLDRPTLTSIHDYWKNHSLTRWTFFGKVISLLFHMLSRLIIDFFQEQVSFNLMAAVTSAVILEPQKIKSATVSIVSPSICHEVMGPILRPPAAKRWLIWKDSDAGKDWRWEEKGMTEDEMVGWQHWLNGHEFE